jgi:hypothetical protein
MAFDEAPQRGYPHEPKFLLAPSMKGDVWMKTRDVSDLIGKSVGQLAAMRQRGSGPHCERYDGRWFYRPSDVIDWLNEQAFKGTYHGA